MIKWLKDKIIFLFELLFSKQVFSAILGASVLIGGYIYNSNKQQDLEKLKIKVDAYSNFLSAVSSGDSIKPLDAGEMNRYISILYIYSPDCVIKDMNNSLTYDSKGNAHTDFKALQKIKLILHNDINNPILCNDKTILTPQDFISFTGWNQ